MNTQFLLVGILCGVLMLRMDFLSSLGWVVIGTRFEFREFGFEWCGWVLCGLLITFVVFIIVCMGLLFYFYCWLCIKKNCF